MDQTERRATMRVVGPVLGWIAILAMSLWLGAGDIVAVVVSVAGWLLFAAGMAGVIGGRARAARGQGEFKKPRLWIALAVIGFVLGVAGIALFAR